MTAVRRGTAIILAGGYSRRFSGDKARQLWRGRQLIEHVCQTALTVCTDVIIVVREEQLTEQWPVERVVSDDPALPPGPLRGIVAGLEAAPSEHVFAAACDTPAIAPGLIAGVLERLQRQAGQLVPVVPQWVNRLQPLHAGYPRSCSSALRKLAAAGEQSPVAALQQIDHEVMSETTCRRLDPSGLSFFNVNSPADLEQLDSLH